MIYEALSYRTQTEEETWNNFLLKTKTKPTSRYPEFYYENTSVFTNESLNAWHNTSAGEKIYYFFDGYVELSTQWVLDTPTWEHDIKACIEWMPYEGYLYSKNTSTQFMADTTPDTFQKTFYEYNLCLFTNKSSYDLCNRSINKYFD